MRKKKPVILVDPYPRTMDLIFSDSNLKYLKQNFNLVVAPKKIKKIFMKKIYQMQNIFLANLIYPLR